LDVGCRCTAYVHVIVLFREPILQMQTVLQYCTIV
jgi:hypothetical protein